MPDHRPAKTVTFSQDKWEKAKRRGTLGAMAWNKPNSEAALQIFDLHMLDDRFLNDCSRRRSTARVETPPESSKRRRMSLIHNEQTKLLANAIDRASTAFFAIGVVGQAFSLPPAPTLSIASMAGWFLAGAALHLAARRILRGLRP